MATGKKSFVLYTDLHHTIQKLPDAKAGILFKTILAYVNDENPIVKDLLIDVTFEPIKRQLKRDLERWDSFREKQAENGKKGGRPPKKDEVDEETQNNPSLLEETQPLESEPTESLNVTVNVNATVNVKKESFALFWDLYDKKRGDKEKILNKWLKLSQADIDLIFAYIPKYKLSEPNKKFRKDPDSFLNNKGWNDEIIEDYTIKTPEIPKAKYGIE